jgi:protein phosphatase
MHIETAAATHTGLVRPVNEDAYLAGANVSVVADGMGGHARGDVASVMTIDAFRKLVASDRLRAEDVLESIAVANQAVLDEGSAHPEMQGMGTTLTGLALVRPADEPHWLVFNVGDSRVYRILADGLRQMTVDHSEVASLIAAGQLTREGAKRHPLRHVVTRSIGQTPPPEVETWLVPVQADDEFLLCSDGLTLELAESEIARIVSESGSLQLAADALVSAAVNAGGRDNITVVLVRAGDVPAYDAEQTAPRHGLAEVLA